MLVASDSIEENVQQQRAKSCSPARWETENCPEKKKALKKSVLFRVAPRPGLEPGTYGLTGHKFVKSLAFMRFAA
jgi:hypothetical protein